MKKLISLFTVCICVSTANVQAQSNFPSRMADSMFHSWHAEGKFNGNVLLAENGKVVYKKSFGLANETTKTPLNDNAVFELASCSKQFTAMAIAMLQHQGKLKFDDDITKYIPELIFYKGITISNLVHHTSGLPDYMSQDSMWKDWDEHKIITNKDVIERFAQYKPALLFGTGTKFDYSNTGYMLLATIIERTSGLTFGAYLSKNIFKPLKMDRSFVYQRRYAPKKVDNYAFGYVMDDSLNRLVLPDNYKYTSYVYVLDGIYGDGCVNSTVNDLLKWDAALYGNQLLPASEMKVIFEPGKLNDGTSVGYGFGWFVKNKGGESIVSHSGSWPGYITYIERNLSKHRTIIMLMNGAVDDIPSKYVNLLMDGKSLPPSVKEIQLPENILSSYLGDYQLTPDLVLTITKEGSQLYGQATGQGKIACYASAEDKFFTKEVDASMEFVKEGNQISKLIWHQGGETIPAPKIK